MSGPYRRTAQIRPAHPVDDDLHTGEVGEDVAVEVALVEEQLVPQTRAAAGLDGDAQGEVLAPLLVEQGLDLRRRCVGEDDTRGRLLSRGGLAHLFAAPQRTDLIPQRPYRPRHSMVA